MDTQKKQWVNSRHSSSVYIWTLTVFAITAMVIFFLIRNDRQISPTNIIFMLFAATAGIFIAGKLQHIIHSFLNNQGVALERVAIFGAGEIGIKLAQRIESEGLDEGQKLVGVFDNRGSRAGENINEFGLSGDWQTIKHLAINEKIDHVVICLPFKAMERIEGLMNVLIGISVKVTLIPDDDRILSNTIELKNLPIYGWKLTGKNIFDRVGVSLGLIVISPFLILVALLIKFDSSGPVFFRQERIGYNNQSFKILKFRTMYGAGEEGQKMKQAVKNDPRITRIGYFLRKYSIDELPQVLNVLFGQMSLVGPRPHAPSDKAVGEFFYDIYEGYASRHRVKPGITGWAQVNGLRGPTHTKDLLIDRVHYDLYYIDNWSFLFDLEILFKTIPAVFKG